MHKKLADFYQQNGKIRGNCNLKLHSFLIFFLFIAFFYTEVSLIFNLLQHPVGEAQNYIHYKQKTKHF